MSYSTDSFPPLKNDLILRVSRGEKTERAPIWIMRQAGRYLPEFHTIRRHHSFFEICRTPELACALTLQPIDRYGSLLDASIIFSDILVIPQALGLEVTMVEGRGPVFPAPLVSPDDMTRLTKNVDVDEALGYVYKAITLTRHKLEGRVPLYGFIGAPWTLMAYMIEGGGSKTLSKAKSWLWKHPEASHELLQRITNVAIDFLVGQVRAGAQMLQVFDSWAGELSPRDFRLYSLPYIQQISLKVKQRLADEGLDKDVPMTIFAKGAWFALEDLVDIGYEVVSLDWTIDPEYARKITKNKVVLQGNMDPSVLYGGDDAIRETATRMVKAFGPQGHIGNLGHGVLPTVDPEALKVYLETVQKVSAELNC